MLIGLTGRAGSGKDSVCNELISQSEITYERIAFADRLKVFCSRIFEVPLNHFYDRELKNKPDERISINKFSFSKSERKHSSLRLELHNELCDIFSLNVELFDTFSLFKNNLDSHDSDILSDIRTKLIRLTYANMSENAMTPREVNQFFGKQFRAIRQSTWIDYVENKIKKTGSDFIVTDCRMPNEIEMIKRLGGKVVFVDGGSRPGVEIYNDESENFIDGFKEIADFVIDNTGSIERLPAQVISIENAIRPTPETMSFGTRL